MLHCLLFKMNWYVKNAYNIWIQPQDIYPNHEMSYICQQQIVVSTSSRRRLPPSSSSLHLICLFCLHALNFVHFCLSLFHFKTRACFAVIKVQHGDGGAAVICDKTFAKSKDRKRGCRRRRRMHFSNPPHMERKVWCQKVRPG